jgi:hypothetical protein
MQALAGHAFDDKRQIAPSQPQVDVLAEIASIN